MVRNLQLRELAKTVNLDDMLFYRPNAATMFKKAIEELGTVLPGTVIRCIFEGIKLCDVSFVDEFIINMQLRVQKLDGVMMILTDYCEDVLTNIEAALSLRNQKSNSRITLLCFSNGQYKILGKLEPSLVETFDAVVRARKITARELMEAFSLPETSGASNRLKKLYDARLICRLTDDTKWQQEYFIPDF